MEETTTKRIRETKAPFDYETFCDIILAENIDIFVHKKFSKYRSRIKTVLGDYNFEVLSKHVLTQALFIQMERAGELRNCRINMFADFSNRSKHYTNGPEELRPLLFLYKIIPKWYEKELGTTYLNKRNKIRESFKLPLDVFIKLECFDKFRLVTPKLTNSGFSYLNDAFSKPDLKFTRENIESILSDVI